MVERREHPGLAVEAGEAFVVVDERLGQDFEGDVAAELGVTRAEHLAHAAGADFLDDLV